MKPGDKVVCVDDRGTAPNMGLGFEIVEGREYVVAWVGMHCDPFYEGTYKGVRLHGVVRGVDPVSGVTDKPFAARRFRPAVSNTTKKQLEVAE